MCWTLFNLGLSWILSSTPGLAQFSKDQELAVLLHKRVVRPTHLSPTSYVAPIFSTEKKDGSTGLILNLKWFNECIQFIHFKMENLQDVFDLMKPGVWMASIDVMPITSFRLPKITKNTSPFLGSMYIQLHVSPQRVFSSSRRF